MTRRTAGRSRWSSGWSSGWPTALTGFVDWLRIARGTPLWRTATAHMIAMVLATAFFLIAIGAGYGDGMDGDRRGRRRSC